ncbi:SDR family oxidoreductase [Rhodococcus sp. HNM0569]|uniref:SDR family oxidoreductase n=1 Tax=Rhodococcus sp. HNM0569 TaxID=2716340 RepID=UPI00146D55F6|nr:SDR family oxidoreductase [Rhodococcus sp. HNM0569]NLU83247.1 SDR family oxidoreductase [Rhodococcus sp. HNM0569]
MSTVTVVVGIGGMGEAIARRQGPGTKLLLSDFDGDLLDRRAEVLRGEGFDVTTRRADVSDKESITALADAAATLGPVTQVVHTAGLSPVQAPSNAILKVDLLGVALSLDAFGAVVAEGGAGVVIASMAGHGPIPLTADQQRALADTPSDELLALPFLADVADNPGYAYSVAKRANHLRVRAQSVVWGARGARVNSISPGVIATPMGQQELGGEHGESMRAMIASSGTGRVGTPSDIAAAAAFLLGPEASFVTGADLLVDGGVVASSLGR